MSLFSVRIIVMLDMQKSEYIHVSQFDLRFSSHLHRRRISMLLECQSKKNPSE